MPRVARSSSRDFLLAGLSGLGFVPHGCASRKLVTHDTDLSDVIDFRAVQAAQRCAEAEAEAEAEARAAWPSSWARVRELPSAHGRTVLTLVGVEGFFFLPAAVPEAQQRRLVQAALSDFPQPPNRTSLSAAHGELPDLWAAAGRGLRLRSDDGGGGGQRGVEVEARRCGGTRVDVELAAPSRRDAGAAGHDDAALQTPVGGCPSQSSCLALCSSPPRARPVRPPLLTASVCALASRCRGGRRCGGHGGSTRPGGAHRGGGGAVAVVPAGQARRPARQVGRRDAAAQPAVGHHRNAVQLERAGAGRRRRCGNPQSREAGAAQYATVRARAEGGGGAGNTLAVQNYHDLEGRRVPDELETLAAELALEAAPHGGFRAEAAIVNYYGENVRAPSRLAGHSNPPWTS
jgi:hypothetical protein